MVMRPEDHWVLNEHRIAGRPSIPGVMYLVMVRAALDHGESADCYVLSSVVLLRPLAVDFGEQRGAVTGETELKGSFQVVSRIVDDPGASWQAHVQELCAFEAISAVTESKEIASLGARLQHKIESGGSSLMGSQVVSELRELGGRDIPIVSFFEARWFLPWRNICSLKNRLKFLQKHAASYEKKDALARRPRPCRLRRTLSPSESETV